MLSQKTLVSIQYFVFFLSPIKVCLLCIKKSVFYQCWKVLVLYMYWLLSAPVVSIGMVTIAIIMTIWVSVVSPPGISVGVSVGVSLRSSHSLCLSLSLSWPLPLSPVSVSVAIVGSVVSTPVSPVRVSLSIRVGSRSLGTGRCFLTSGKTKEGQGNLWKKIGKINSEKVKIWELLTSVFI